jgi:hypothetical protein
VEYCLLTSVPSRKFANEFHPAETLCRSPRRGGILWPRAKPWENRGLLPPSPLSRPCGRGGRGVREALAAPRLGSCEIIDVVLFAGIGEMEMGVLELAAKRWNWGESRS